MGSSILFGSFILLRCSTLSKILISLFILHAVGVRGKNKRLLQLLRWKDVLVSLLTQKSATWGETWDVHLSATGRNSFLSASERQKTPTFFWISTHFALLEVYLFNASQCIPVVPQVFGGCAALEITTCERKKHTFILKALLQPLPVPFRSGSLLLLSVLE